jgi:mannose-6-phosphate isomerase
LYDFPPGTIAGEAGWVSAAVANGPLAGKTLHELIGRFGKELLGDVNLTPDGQFPILIKYLDAREDLSIQVHPPQSYCDIHSGAHLKSEAWYIVQNEPNARILKGLQSGVTRQQFQSGIAAGTVESLIPSIPVKPGHCHYLPSGTVHALGAGILAAEVQTPSDTTFRVFDFNRIESATGKPRKLHIDEALDCIDFTANPEPAQRRSHVGSYFTTVSRLVTSPYFILEKVRMSQGIEEAIPYNQPVVWMMLEGSAELRVATLAEPVKVGRGDTLLFPAAMQKPTIKTQADCAWLEVTFPG